MEKEMVRVIETLSAINPTDEAYDRLLDSLDQIIDIHYKIYTLQNMDLNALNEPQDDTEGKMEVVFHYEGGD